VVNQATGMEVGPAAFTAFNFTGNAAAEPLPEECAAVLTLLAPDSDADGRYTRNSRGRIYIGPLNVLAIGADSPGHRIRLVENCLDAGAAFGERLGGAIAAHTFGETINQWVVYSRTLRSINIINSVRMDNAVDIQRRRGPDPSDFRQSNF